MKKFQLLLLLTLLLGSHYTWAQDLSKYGVKDNLAPIGLQVGEEAPNIEATDREGKPFRLTDALQQGPVVLIFFRGFWCPSCVGYLGQYADSLQQLRAKGVQLVMVSPESYEHQLRMVQKDSATNHSAASKLFVLADKDDRIMRDYGVRFELTAQYDSMLTHYLKEELVSINQQPAPSLPVPATYVIDRQGVIRWRHFDINFKQRAHVREIMEHLGE